MNDRRVGLTRRAAPSERKKVKELHLRSREAFLPSFPLSVLALARNSVGRKKTIVAAALDLSLQPNAVSPTLCPRGTGAAGAVLRSLLRHGGHAHFGATERRPTSSVDICKGINR